jgi:hypothetical protein
MVYYTEHARLSSLGGERPPIYHKEEEARLVKYSNRISALATKISFNVHESEAILAHLYPSDNFKKDTLLALKALNRFANENGIRVEDAVVVIREYA